MKVPIQNIYYLLCYSWNKLEEKEIVNVNASDYSNDIDLFSKVLINGCAHLLKRGLDRNYVRQEDVLSGIRGKVLISQTIKQNLLDSSKTYCEFDEFDYNILHNRILKTTIYNLIRTEDLDIGLKGQLLTIYKKLNGIEIIEITTQLFSRVTLHRNNSFYDFLLRVCLIIHENTFINEESGRFKFKSFIDDEYKMRRLFEDFVRNFYRKEQSLFSVSSQVIHWNAVTLSGTHDDLVPIMRTDITLEAINRKIIIDTKYYRHALITSFNKYKIRSENLYQLFSYLKNDVSNTSGKDKCEGILLYPTVSIELKEKYKIHGHTIQVATINLDKPWRNIHDSLLHLIN
jgi:5-methylcytosine-specific restriction enzyme subunit McrC